MFSLHQSHPTSDDLYLQQLQRRRAELEAEERAILERRAFEQHVRRIQEQEQRERQIRIAQANAEHRRRFLHAQRLSQQEAAARAQFFPEPRQSHPFLRREPRAELLPDQRRAPYAYAGAHAGSYGPSDDYEAPSSHPQDPLSFVLNSVFGPQPLGPQAHAHRHAGRGRCQARPSRHSTPVLARLAPESASAQEAPHTEGADFIKALQEAFLSMNDSYQSEPSRSASAPSPSTEEYKAPDAEKAAQAQAQDSIHSFLEFIKLFSQPQQATHSEPRPAATASTSGSRAPASASAPVSRSASTSIAAPAAQAPTPTEPLAHQERALKDLLQDRLNNEYETEIRDTIQAIFNSLATPQPTPSEPTASSSQAQSSTPSFTPAPSGPEVAVDVKGKGKETALPEDGDEKTEPTPTDIHHSLSEIASIETAYCTLKSDFAFPASLDFTPTSSTPSTPLSTTLSLDLSDSTTHNLAYTSRNAPVRYYTHALSGLLARLDEIESWGHEDVRRRRKEVVDVVERALEDAEWEIEGRRRAWERKKASAAAATPAASELEAAPVFATPAAQETATEEEIFQAVAATPGTEVEVTKSKPSQVSAGSPAPEVVVTAKTASASPSEELSAAVLNEVSPSGDLTPPSTESSVTPALDPIDTTSSAPAEVSAQEPLDDLESVQPLSSSDAESQPVEPLSASAIDVSQPGTGPDSDLGATITPASYPPTPLEEALVSADAPPSTESDPCQALDELEDPHYLRQLNATDIDDSVDDPQQSEQLPSVELLPASPDAEADTNADASSDSQPPAEENITNADGQVEAAELLVQPQPEASSSPTPDFLTGAFSVQQDEDALIKSLSMNSHATDGVEEQDDDAVVVASGGDSNESGSEWSEVEA